jgi:hypothetical protein
MIKLITMAFDKALPALRTFFTSNGAAASRLAKRIGSNDGNIAGILAAARANPVTAAFVALEAGELGADLLSALRTEHPEMVSQLEIVSAPVDSVDDNSTLSDLEKFKDEIDMLDDMSAILGGDNNLYAMLKCVEMVRENNNILILRERLQQFKR